MIRRCSRRLQQCAMPIVIDYMNVEPHEILDKIRDTDLRETCGYVVPFSRKLNSKKGKVIPYPLQSFGLGADPGVQAVSPQVTKSSPGGRLPLLSERPAFYFRKPSPDGATLTEKTNI